MGKEELNQNRDCIPTSEISISPEKYNVLSAMYDVRPNGRDLPQFLVQQALLGRRMGYFGPPGVGKTTVMTQVISCARENAERLGLNYEPTIAQYDLVNSQGAPASTRTP